MGAVIAAVLAGTLLAGAIAPVFSEDESETWIISTRWESERWKISELLSPGVIQVISKDLDLDLRGIMNQLGMGAHVYVLADKAGSDHVIFVTSANGVLQTYLAYGRAPSTREAEGVLFSFLSLPEIQQPLLGSPGTPALADPGLVFEIQPYEDPQIERKIGKLITAKARAREFEPAFGLDLSEIDNYAGDESDFDGLFQDDFDLELETALWEG